MYAEIASCTPALLDCWQGSMGVAAVVTVALVCSAAQAHGGAHGASSSEWEANARRWPWFNQSLPLEKRLDRLVTAMTADELISQLVKYSQRIDRLGVPAYAWHMEAAHGVVTGGDSTSFPCSLARAATFNPEMERQIAQAIGVEARAKWNDFIRLHGAPPAYHSEGLALTLYAPEINVRPSPPTTIPISEWPQYSWPGCMCDSCAEIHAGDAVR
jgi:hypothetical protein